MKARAVREMFERNVVPSYARFDLVLERGQGSYVWDVDDNRYLDMGGGIAVCVLGHAHPEIADALYLQARTLTHVSNLYYHELQGRLAQELVDLIAPGCVFFCNSGAEANEGCSSSRENTATRNLAMKSLLHSALFTVAPWPELPRPVRTK